MTTTAVDLMRADNRWTNQFNTFGTSADPIARTVFGLTSRLPRTEVEALFRHNWLARAVIESLAEDATREWVSFVQEDEGARVDDLSDALETLDIRSKFKEAITVTVILMISN